MNSNLGLNKSQFEQIDKRLENITSTKVEEIEIEMNNPPTIEQLSDSNKSYSINCSILFIDIRKSTDLSDKSHAKSMVKIYRSFMRMAVDCVRKNLGVTRQFLGDRIMGVFMDDKDENGNIITLGVDKAVYCARTMQTVLDYSLNKHISNNINKELGKDFWMKRIDDIFEMGGKLGKSELQIKRDLDVYLIDIYYLFGDYHKSYEYLLIMAQYSSWLTWKYRNIIPKVKTSWKLKETLEKRISTMKDEKIREEFENHYKEISKIYWS